jgi:hypothetical protein
VSVRVYRTVWLRPGKYHWPVREPGGVVTGCSGYRVLDRTGVDPGAVPVGDRCGSRPCRDRWAAWADSVAVGGVS